MSNELLNHQPEIISLDKISPEQHIRVKETIDLKGGEVLVLIHPFYEIRHSDETEEVADYLHSNRERNAVRDGGGVVIVFDNKDNLGRTMTKLTTSSNSLLCTLESEKENAHPEGDESLTIDEKWTKAIELLDTLGIKKIRIGGRKFIYDRDGTPSGCVPQAINYLKRKFEISVVPELCYPDTPYYITVDKIECKVSIPSAEITT